VRPRRLFICVADRGVLTVRVPGSGEPNVRVVGRGEPNVRMRSQGVLVMRVSGHAYSLCVWLVGA
jgi:hypothetical protein